MAELATSIQSTFEMLMQYYPLVAVAVAIISTPVIVFVLQKVADDTFDATYFGLTGAAVMGIMWPITIIFAPMALLAMFASWLARR